MSSTAAREPRIAGLHYEAEKLPVGALPPEPLPRNRVLYERAKSPFKRVFGFLGNTFGAVLVAVCAAWGGAMLLTLLVLLAMLGYDLWTASTAPAWSALTFDSVWTLLKSAWGFAQYIGFILLFSILRSRGR